MTRIAAVTRGAFILCCLVPAASAATITLNLVATYQRTAPFGLAWDGSHIYWSDSSTTVHQMTLSGVDTGVAWSAPVWSELAYDSVRGQLASAQFQTIYYYDIGGGNLTTQTLNDAMAGFTGLQDGFDIDDGEVWISPDVGNVYRFNQAAGDFLGANPFLGGAGGYSGVERVDVGAATYILVVNDALSPRRLCVHDLAATELGCQNFVNQRYEGLAFDGRYLWAADYFGNKIDKFDVLSDGGSIFEPIPEPGTILLISTGLALLGWARFRTKSTN